MNPSFGPWTTAINTGAPQQLDTFWKRRLAMLPTLNQPESRVTRRTLLFMGAVAVAALAFPTIKWATSTQFAGPAAAFADDAAQATDAGKRAAGADRREKASPGTKGRDTAVEVEFLPRPTKFEEKILAALEEPIDIQFLELTLEDCLTYLEEAAKIPMWLDRQKLTDEGVALDQPILLKLKGARLESVLNLLLSPVQLAFLPENDVLVITTSAAAGEKMITRTYPVRDLYQGRVESDAGEPALKNDKAAAGAEPARGVASIESRPLNKCPQVIGVIRQLGATKFGGEIDVEIAQGIGGGGQGGVDNGGAVTAAKRAPPKKYADLLEAIINTIQPDSWEDLSGRGSYTYVKETGCLVIRQTWAIHREILQLLRDLREAKHLPPGGKALTPASDVKQ